MEVGRGKRSTGQLKPRNKRELIVQHWKALGQPAVGARQLKTIQEQLAHHFGEAAIESPAAIARVLADEGAELRHPDVIEFDADWREARIQNYGQKFPEIDFPEVGEPLTLEGAERFIKDLEELRLKFERTNEQNSVQQIRVMAIEARRAAQQLARRRTLLEARRAEQIEVAEWLGVWIKTPSLFGDWLELRRRSVDFRGKFSKSKSFP
jgi:hypothetical protein